MVERVQEEQRRRRTAEAGRSLLAAALAPVRGSPRTRRPEQNARRDSAQDKVTRPAHRDRTDRRQPLHSTPQPVPAAFEQLARPRSLFVMVPDHPSADVVLECGLTVREASDLMFRDITTDDYDALLRLDESLPRRTLTEERLKKCMKDTKGVQFKASEACGVCLSEDADNDVVRLTCGHAFHAGCIQRWLTEYRDTCPLDGKQL